VTSFANELAGVCVETAEVFTAGLEPKGPSASPKPIWELERELMKARLGNDEPHKWIYSTAATCLSDSAEQLHAIALLLEAERGVGSLEVITRALVERMGLHAWLLDHQIEAPERASRAFLAWIVGLQHYRSALARLDGPRSIRKPLKEERKRLENLGDEWFSIDRPRDVDGRSTPDASQWKVDGTGYPNLTRLCLLALESGMTPDQAAGTYDLLSGFSHPSPFFSQEHRDVGHDPTSIRPLPDDYLERVVRVAVMAFIQNLRRWIGYYLDNGNEAIRSTDEICNHLDSITLLGT
jgi:hypothetical protein